jgi:hypothetical protein
MKQFFSVLFLFVLVSGFSFAQDAADINPNPPVNTFIPEGQNIPTPFESDFALLFDGGPMITHPGGGAGGSDASAVQTALLMSLYGFGAQISAGNSMADDFTVTGAGWNIDEMQFFTYQTGSTTTSTITDLRIQIYNGPPNAGGTVVWGDLTTNRLTLTSFTNIYRVLDTGLSNNQRPIMRAVAQLSPAVNLAPGTYWVEFQFGGTLSSGPWAPPVSILGQTTTGNALQKTSTGWAQALDTGSGSVQGMPFLIMGTEAGAAYFFEDFDGFIAGQQVACQDPVNWTTWSQLPCSAEDATVSTVYAHSAPNSFVIVPGNDFVKPLGDKTAGVWYISLYMYIPAGKAGYFNTLNTFPASTSGHWGMEVYFGDLAQGQGRLLADAPATTNFTFSHNTWLFVTVMVNLDTDQAQFWLNNTMIHQWQWTRGNPTTYAKRVAANDFYGPLQTAVDECYYDDYWFADFPVPVELTSFTANVNNLSQVVLNWETASEINNQGFEIERRTESSEFRTIGFVEGYGTTTEPRSYVYTDVTAELGVNYYRLKQVDYNGKYAYSDVVEIDVTAPLTFDLAQNYPNPFNPSTSIKYSVPESGNIRLSVFNIVGEEVAVLADGFTQAGFYEVTFDASNLSTGVYLYKLQSANSVQTKKMMLLK